MGIGSDLYGPYAGPPDDDECDDDMFSNGSRGGGGGSDDTYKSRFQQDIEQWHKDMDEKLSGR